MERSELAGKDVTETLQRLFQKEGHTFRTSSEMEMIRRIKDDSAYVALDYERELQVVTPIRYELPDKEVLNLGKERFQCAEILFHPSLLGLEKCTPSFIISLLNEALMFLFMTFSGSLQFGGSLCW
jgi:actin, other eukaryote